MRFTDVCVEAVSCVLPERVVTTEEIEKRLTPVYERLRLPLGRLELMTGITERRFWRKGTTPSDASANAGEKALAQAGVDREQVGCLVHGAVCRDFMEPATASVIHRKLGLPQHATIFDLSNACLGVLTGIVMIANMIALGQILCGLVVCGEVGGPLVDTTIDSLLADQGLTRKSIKGQVASLTIGSGAAAVLLVHASLSKKSHRLLGGATRTASEHSGLCQGDNAAGKGGFTPLMNTDSETLLKRGCELAGHTWEDCRRELSWENGQVDKVFTHQVGKAHRKLLFETLDLDLDKDYPTVEFLGNTGSAALPTALALGAEDGRLRSGDRVALLGIGSGLSCTMLGLEW